MLNDTQRVRGGAVKFIEALKFRSKLFFLFVFISLGLVVIGVVGASYINAMKRSVDSLYFGSLMPVNELHEIVHTYYGTTQKVLQQGYNHTLSAQETTKTLNRSLHHIQKLWNSYKSRYKSQEEMAYVEYVGLEIKKTNEYLRSVAERLQQGKQSSTLLLEKIEKQIENIDLILKKLIRYEVEVAQYERVKFLEKYDTITQKLGAVLVLVLIAVLAISMYVFRSIQEDNTKLAKAAKKLKIANKKLENASYIDSLTNLHNRRYFNLIYERELARAKREKNYITFMMLDIDYFKQYNDTYGHVEGDFALKSVAKVLKDTLKRPSDYVFRLGGEEFGVLLSGTNESDSATIARKICQAVEARGLTHEKSKVSKVVTISIGVVCCVADEALDDEVLISRADEMLYAAKESGRNRYHITTNVSDAKTVSA